MSYYGAGDYYGAGGIGSFLKKAAGTLVSGAVGLVTGGPAGALANVSRSVGILPNAPSGSRSFAATPQVQIPQININPMAALPGGQPLFTFGGKRRRRMNFANGKALNRANRRVDGFVRLARRSLKHTGYRVVTKGSGRKRSVNVHESGPGGVTVR
jgi:hypothetical protein